MADKTKNIVLSGVGYKYPDTGFEIFVDELIIENKNCIALCGKNGSGKTTLGKLVAGLLRPDVGEVSIGGEGTTGWSLGRFGKEVGYLFQEPSKQIFAPIVKEEMTFPLTLKGISQQDADCLAQSSLARFELLELWDKPTYTLSRGEKQRLAISAMLTGKPRFLVLDEPTTGLDERRQEILGQMLVELKSQGMGILLISHHGEFVKRYAENIICLNNGRIER